MHVPMSYCHTHLPPSLTQAGGRYRRWRRRRNGGGGGGGHGGGDGGGSAAPDVQRCRSGIGDALRGLQTRAINSWMDGWFQSSP